MPSCGNRDNTWYREEGEFERVGGSLDGKKCWMAFATACGFGAIDGKGRREFPMMLRTILGCRRVLLPTRLARLNSSLSSDHTLRTDVETDEHGIPVRPTWSVNELLSSYPKPTISPATLKHLHTLSALIPPEEDSPEHAKLTEEMQDLVKLVEAVKLVNTDSVDDGNGVPDGRIWAEGVGIDLDAEPVIPDETEVQGRGLLKYAKSVSPEGLYLIDSDRSK